MAEETYAGVYFLKAAMDRAGTTETEKVIAAIEKEPLAWETPEGWKIMRKEDHAVVERRSVGGDGFQRKNDFTVLKTSTPSVRGVLRTPRNEGRSGQL